MKHGWGWGSHSRGRRGIRHAAAYRVSLLLQLPQGHTHACTHTHLLSNIQGPCTCTIQTYKHCRLASCALEANSTSWVASVLRSTLSEEGKLEQMYTVWSPVPHPLLLNHSGKEAVMMAVGSVADNSKATSTYMLLAWRPSFYCSSFS